MVPTLGREKLGDNLKMENVAETLAHMGEGCRQVWSDAGDDAEWRGHGRGGWLGDLMDLFCPFRAH